MTATVPAPVRAASGGEEVLPALVVSRREAADGVVEVVLRPTGGTRAWEPGAHVDVLTPAGPRQYSLCGTPGADTWSIAVLREAEGRGGSAWIHDALVPGAQVDVRGPRNHFALAPSARYLFLAGGIGITPLLPMLAAAEAAGAEWQLVHCGRTRTAMAFADRLEGEHPDRVRVHPRDEYGRADLVELLEEPQADTLVYCCGPESLLAEVEQLCAAWPAGSLRTERFAPKDVGAPVLSGPFEVELVGSGLVLTVPEHRSILEVVEDAGIPVPSSCSEGTCGTCETAVVDGVADHRDSVLDEDEHAAGKTMMICVSRAACPRLALDL